MADEGYEGVTHAGIALVSVSTGEVLLAQRSFDDSDDPDVQETWEFPGGGLNPGEDAQAGAFREFTEEIGLAVPPDAVVVDGWRSDDGVYQGFVVHTEAGFAEEEWNPTDEVQAVAWVTRDDLPKYTLRPEVETQTDWSLIFGAVSGNSVDEGEQDMDEAAEYASIEVMPIPVHGVVAPEETEAGDGRGFASGAMSRRPLRLPFRDTATDIGSHDGAFVVGSVDRLMRADGLVHWEGLLMPAAATDPIVGKMAFFDGRYGVSVDGDQGSIDPRTKRTEKGSIAGPLWFDQIRASGLTTVDIPAFHEAHVAFGYHPTMPGDEALVASAHESGDLIGGRITFDRGPGWVTDPKATKNIHDYWTKKGEEGYAKIGWGTPGDFTRAKALIGAKIAKHSPEKMKYLNQIIAQWHFDALGYWPGDLGKPGNAPDTAENRQRAARHATAAMERGLIPISEEDQEAAGATWEAVLTSSAGVRVRPSIDYFSRHPNTGATTVEEVDENGLQRTHGYAAEWGVCHIGMSGRCVEPPRTYSDEYPDFHLGYTRLDDGSTLNTGVLTYKVDHRDAHAILTETAEQQHFDNVEHAWAAVRIGEDERGIWFSGVVLPGIPEEDVVLIEAAGQVSGEWKYGSLRACQAVNVPGYPVLRSSAAFDDDGNVIALVAVTAGDAALVASVNGVEGSECYENSPKARMAALAKVEAEARMDAAREQYKVNWGDLAGKVGN